MAKKPKKESIETKLAEIGKAGEITKMEAQLEFLNNYINEKIDRVGSINEDDNLKELVDKKKMKDMMKEIKLLEKRKAKMEKMYEKMSGKKYKEMVDEQSPQATFDQSNPTGGPTLDPITQKAGRSTGKSYINRPSGPAKFPQ
jgi:23S rRNA maturation-related 3'-5' exoribonuclease YhaM